MERRINNKINTFQKKFKDDIVALLDTEFKKLKENELDVGDELNGGKLEHQFGYFTPNLTSKDAIFLNNNTQNEIEIIRNSRSFMK